MTPVTTAKASASGSVTFGSVKSVGGTFPVALVHAVASSLRSRNTPPVTATVVTSCLLAKSAFLAINSSYLQGRDPGDARGNHPSPVLTGRHHPTDAGPRDAGRGVPRPPAPGLQVAAGSKGSSRA